MKAEAKNIQIERSGNFQERAMGLAVGSESFIFNVLRKDLYSDPVGSLLREYIVNAKDEHRKYNVNKPVLVQVPNNLVPELHVRDFANGLTEEQVYEFFGQYGASDKRDSNDVVGFYGLGCKSAFAYTDSYIVKSFKNGTVFTFNIYIDETEIGRVAKISEEATDEPNGVEIIVPVKTSDINDFQYKAINTVEYFDVKPTFEGLSYTPDFGEKESKIEGDGWKFFGAGRAVCIMGEIAYPINTNVIDDLESWERGLLNSDLHIYVNIGDVQVTASREALQMSEKTIKAIRERLVEIKNTMVEKTLEAFKNAKNLFEAKSLYYTNIIRGEGFGRIIRESGAVLTWNGIEIENNSVKLNDTDSMVHYSKNWKGTIKESGKGSILRCGEDVDVYFDDVTDKHPLYKRRAKTLLADKNSVVFIHTTNKKALEKVLGTSVKVFQSLQAVTPAPQATRAYGGHSVDKSKHTATMFMLNLDKLMNGYWNLSSEVWDIKTVSRKGGIFIPINRFKPQLNSVDSLDGLKTRLALLKRLGVSIPTVFYGVKNTDSVEGMISFDDWFTKKVNSLTEQKERFSLVESYYSFQYELLDFTETDLTKLSDEVKKYTELYKEAKDAYMNWTLWETVRRVFSMADVKVEPSVDLKIMSDSISEKYPLLALITDLEDERVLDYMRGIDNKILN